MAHNDSPLALAWVSAIAGTLFGVILGYALAMRGVGPAAGPIAPGGGFTEVQPMGGDSAQTGPPPTAVVSEAELQNWRNVLAADPKNGRAATELGNRLYDAGRYAEAIPYYEQAFALSPKDVNVSTDLGTSHWYSGNADAAIAQFKKSLAVNATHPQTLFNMGIVLLNGKQDAAGAVAAWEKLLATSPSSPEAAKARPLLDEARQRLVPAPARSAR